MYVLCSRNSRKQMWKTNACMRKMFERVKKKSMKEPINMPPTPKNIWD